jgi:arylsulfatase A-like enzyme
MAGNSPNILVFMTDDHGQWASSAYGNREIHSPTMQWLADTGTRFDHAYCPLPVCSPARASFWTGRIPSTHGIHDWIAEPGENEDLPSIEGQKTLARFMKDGGYRTGMIGKWHCGSYWRKQDGFDTWFTSSLGTNARFGKQAYYEDEALQEFQGHQAPILTDRAVRFLQEHHQADSDKPFFLFVGYTNTHTPHAGEPEAIVSHYRKGEFADIPLEPYTGQHGHPRIAPFDPREDDRREQLAQYYAAVDVIDRQMARLMTELHSLGELENTLVVYTSDHGHMNGHHGLHTKGNATIPTNFLDESIHVPCLARWPGVIPAGRAESAPVDHCDLFATLIEAAGMDPGAAAREVRSPGRSWLPLLQGEKPEWRDYQFCEHAYSRMIRTGSYKLIRRYPNKVTRWDDAFYDLEQDPRETRNVLADPAYAEVIRKLDARLKDHFSTYENPELAGTNMATIQYHNQRDPWEALPGQDDHRQ